MTARPPDIALLLCLVMAGLSVSANGLAQGSATNGPAASDRPNTATTFAAVCADARALLERSPQQRSVEVRQKSAQGFITRSATTSSEGRLRWIGETEKTIDDHVLTFVAIMISVDPCASIQTNLPHVQVRSERIGASATGIFRGFGDDSHRVQFTHEPPHQLLEVQRSEGESQWTLVIRHTDSGMEGTVMKDGKVAAHIRISEESVD